MLPEPLHSVIIGSLLGDACLERNGRWWRLRIDHKEEAFAYVEWKYQKLQPIAAAPPRRVVVWDRRVGRSYKHARLDTRSIPELSWYAERFYPQGQKQIPEDIASLLTTTLALAVWYMDDGHRRLDCRALRLNTQAFPRQDVARLVAVLKDNFAIEGRVHRVVDDQWVIYIPASQAQRFCDQIRHHIPPVMEYKLL